MTTERDTPLLETAVQKAAIADGLKRERAQQDEIAKWKRFHTVEETSNRGAALELNQTRLDLVMQRQECLALQDTVKQMKGHTADRDVAAMSAALTQAREQVMALSVGMLRHSEDTRILSAIIHYTVNSLQESISRTTDLDLNHLIKAIAELIRKVQSKLDKDMTRK